LNSLRDALASALLAGRDTCKLVSRMFIDVQPGPTPPRSPQVRWQRVIRGLFVLGAVLAGLGSSPRGMMQGVSADMALPHDKPDVARRAQPESHVPQRVPDLAVVASMDSQAGPRPDPAMAVLRPAMVAIRSGRFLMGLPASGEWNDRKPQHKVQITVPFLLSATKVTQAHYQAVMGNNPSRYSDQADAANRAVETVSWMDAVRYCNELSRREQLQTCYVIDGNQVTWPNRQRCTGYRLPTEAEWEYAIGPGESRQEVGPKNLDEMARHRGEPGTLPMGVGIELPDHWNEHFNTKRQMGNRWDQNVNSKPQMSNRWDQNVNSMKIWEWVWDWWRDSYANATSIDPMGPTTGEYRVLRLNSTSGGRWREDPSFRARRSGFRLARSTP
jgi:formylglycine-generating enzyme required for sulfatase activity